MSSIAGSPAAEREIATVAVVGAGAMGGMYAALFAAAGIPVAFVAGGTRAELLRHDGLIVNGTALHIPVHDPDSADTLHPADLVIVAVKHRHLAEAADEMACVVGPHTVIMSVLNGLNSEELLAERFGSERVLHSIAFAMDAMREGNRIRYSQTGRLVFGVVGATEPDARVLAVQRVLDRAGLPWHTPVDIRREIWWKFMVNVGVNQASAVLRAPYGAFVGDGRPKALCDALMREVITVANAEGVDLGESDLERWYRVVANQPADGKTSMHQDVEARRPTEVDIFAGHVVALGHKHGLPTPVNLAMTWIIPELGHD